MPTFVALAALGACMAAPGSRKPGPGRAARIVVVMGSSTAAGVGASRKDSSWVGRIAAEAARSCPEVEVANLAKSGYNTFQLMPSAFREEGRSRPDASSNIESATALGPALVILQAYANDPGQGIPASETLRNNRVLLRILDSLGIPSIEVAPFPRRMDPRFAREMLQLRDSLPLLVPARRRAVVWDSLALDSLRVLPRFGSGDGVHLGNAGHAVIARQVLASPAWRDLCPPR